MDNRSPSGGEGSLSRESDYVQVSHLHAIAEQKCRKGALLVVGIIRRTFGQVYNSNGQQNAGCILFQFDASLVRDGIFFAGFLLASEVDVAREGDLEYCLSALREMRWAFSKSEEREHNLTMVWETRTSQAQQMHGRSSNYPLHREDEISVNVAPPSPYRDDFSPTTGRRLLRPQLPPPISTHLDSISRHLGT